MIDKSRYTPRTTLADNVKALMKAKIGPTSQPVLAEKSGVGQNTISRIVSARGENARIETVAKIAKVYGIELWQLLVPGLEPTNPPVLMPMTKEEKALHERLRQAFAELAKLQK